VHDWGQQMYVDLKKIVVSSSFSFHGSLNMVVSNNFFFKNLL